MQKQKRLDFGLKVLATGILICAFLLTFTMSDYYIFNRFSQFNALFIISQWVKKASLLLIPLAIYYRRRNCADAVKYILPVFVVFSCIFFGDFFDITKAVQTPEQEIYNNINMFIPKWLNIALFFMQNTLIIGVCGLLFIRDGFGVKLKSFFVLAPAAILCMPLNIFENFFDINDIPADSFLRFYNFTVWHALAIVVLFAFVVSCYLFLRNKTEEQKDLYLAALAIVLLIQYHSKDSIVIGDGYNVYHTVFACIPLFICNIGVYVASASVIIKKKTLYAISFFIHAVGALSVFVYFGKDELSNYGIFCSYSILYFCLTHCILFALSVMPTALGRYKFTFRDCIVPLVYYLIVIILAAVCSAIVTSASMTWTTASGTHLTEGNYLYPNYAFTQKNPLPFELPLKLPLTIWKYDLDLIYLSGLYLFYTALFFAFNGLYFAFIAIKKKIFERHAYTVDPDARAEAAATEERKSK